MQNSTYGTDISLLNYVYGSSSFGEIIGSPQRVLFNMCPERQN